MLGITVRKQKFQLPDQASAPTDNLTAYCHSACRVIHLQDSITNLFLRCISHRLCLFIPPHALNPEVRADSTNEPLDPSTFHTTSPPECFRQRLLPRTRYPSRQLFHKQAPIREHAISSPKFLRVDLMASHRKFCLRDCPFAYKISSLAPSSSFEQHLLVVSSLPHGRYSSSPSSSELHRRLHRCSRGRAACARTQELYPLPCGARCGGGVALPCCKCTLVSLLLGMSLTFYFHQNEWGQTHAITFVNNHPAIAAVDCTLKLCNDLIAAIPGYKGLKDGYLTKLRDLHGKVERAQAVCHIRHPGFHLQLTDRAGRYRERY